MSEQSTDGTEQITKLKAKQAVREAYEEKKSEWKSGDVVVKEMRDLYLLAVQRIEHAGNTDTERSTGGESP